MGIILLKIGLLILAYLFGSIPSGLFVGKVFKGVLLHKEGSKNIGTSNAIRVLGLPYGILTLVLDFIKTSLVLVVVLYWLPNLINDFNTIIKIGQNSYNYAIIYGVMAIIGHTFSIFLKFQGGKAVASSFAVVTIVTPIPGLIALCVYFSVVAITKYASVGSTIASLFVLLGALVQYLITDSLTENLFTFIVYCLLVLFVVIKHIPNYIRLFKGVENKMYLTKRAKEKAQL